MKKKTKLTLKLTSPNFATTYFLCYKPKTLFWQKNLMMLYAA
jgi:hypothetical protein